MIIDQWYFQNFGFCSGFRYVGCWKHLVTRLQKLITEPKTRFGNPQLGLYLKCPPAKSHSSIPTLQNMMYAHIEIEISLNNLLPLCQRAHCILNLYTLTTSALKNYFSENTFLSSSFFCNCHKAIVCILFQSLAFDVSCLYFVSMLL